MERLEDYAAKCASFYSDDMFVSYYPQTLLPTTVDTVNEALHRMTMDQRFPFSNVVRLAQAEGQMYRARPALYEKKATVRASRNFVMLIANSLDTTFDDYSTEPLTSLEPESNPYVLKLDTEQTADVWAPSSYRNADIGLDTLGITAMIQQVFPSQFSSV